jgi:fibronectin type 3 domain-containing protein
VTPQSQTEITITWNDTALDFVGFTLIRQAGAGSYTSFALPTPIQGATSFSYTDTGLTANTIYTYQIVANNLGGNSAPSNAISATTLPNPPLAPVNLTAVAVSNTLVNLYWQPGSGNELGFQIERVTTGGAFQQVGQTGPGFTAASDTVPTGGTLYTYRIRSFNAGGESPYSNSAQVTTLPDPPVAPTNLEASPQSSTAIALSWTTNSTTQTGFQIDRAIGDGPFSVLATPLGTASGYVDSYDLTAGTSVSYEILAFNGTGTSAFSPTVTVVTLQTPATVPAAPGNLTAAPLSQTQVSLGWTPNSTNATGYEVQRLNGTGGWELLTPKPITTTTYTDTTAFANTTFTYEVIAIDAVGNSQPSPTVQVTTRPNPPAAPSSVTATAQSSTSVIVTWVSNSPNATFFFIQRASTAPGSTFQTVGQPPANAGTTFVDQTAAAGTTYIYRVLAQNTGGTSGPSNQVTVTTP